MGAIAGKVGAVFQTYSGTDKHKLIADFQDDESWVSGAGTQSDDGTNYRLGTESIKILELSNVYKLGCPIESKLILWSSNLQLHLSQPSSVYKRRGSVIFFKGFSLDKLLKSEGGTQFKDAAPKISCIPLTILQIIKITN
jgi:hypothetical protein